MSQTLSKSKLPKNKTSQGLLGRSELIRNIQNLLDNGLPQSQTRFSERLTQNMDFSSSLKLSELHGHLRVLEKKAEQKPINKPASEPKKALNGAYERVHRSILQNIEQSFDASVAQARFPLPKVDLESEPLDLSAYEKFYKAQQVEMSAKIQGLRTFVRETLSASTLNMAKLALLDQTLEDTIGFPLRSGFLAVSKVVASYSQKIQETLTSCSYEEKQAQLTELHNALHQLLLSELALRLHAVQGLLDAFNQEVS